MKKNSFFATLLLLFITTASNAQTLLSQNFDTALNWTVAHPVGASTNAGWTQVSEGFDPETTPFAGAGMAMFNSYNINVTNSYSLTSPAINFTAGSYRVTFSMYRDVDYLENADKIEVFLNTTASSTGGTLLGTVNRSIELAPAVSQEGWYMYSFNIPANTTGTRYISFLATTAYGNNMFIDEVLVESVPTTAPACATNFVASPNACGNFENSISWSAAQGASGYHINVGSTPGGTDIANNETVITPSYQFTGSHSTVYYYTVTPYNNIGSASGCSEQTITTSSTQCYCPSVPQSVDNLGITQLTLGSTIFESAMETYVDFTEATVDLGAGLNTNLQITFETGYTYDTNVWIDFNNDFDFNDAGELLISAESTDDDETTLNASFILPANSPVGPHRMRIGAADGGQETPDPCFSGFYGVTLDFTINIVAADCTPASATAEITADCDEDRYYITVDVTDLGSGTPSLSDGTTEYPITTVGTITVGPYASGSSTILTLLHGGDDVCDILLGNFAYTCPPSNDDCLNAVSLPLTATYQEGTVGNVEGATDSGETETDCAGYEGADVWYSVVIPQSGSVTFETGYAESDLNDGEGEDQDNFDTVITAYSGTCGNLVLIDCDDDTAGAGFSSLSLTGQTPGSTVFLRVFEYGNDEPGDNFTISAFDASLNNNDFTSNSLKVYPNPVKGLLNVSNSANIKKVVVYNVLGQQVNVVEANSTDTQIDLSALTQGTYFVQITSQDTIETVKVIKQ
ncbi:MAG TPA: GEVED domain-containing protein [Flavobacterium sp.]